MDVSPSIHKLFPELASSDLPEAQEDLRRYLRLSLKLYERICEDPDEYARFRQLLVRRNRDTIEGTDAENPSAK